MTASPLEDWQSCTIEVAYATDEQQVIVALELPENSTVETAINASGLLTRFPEIELSAVGIFGKACELHQLLKTGDRVEIYRPLHNDPKEARRQRAKK
ncbi:MAG: RnfH family protein [Methylococcales bacterium]|nr:RnfH family protein [Methylococcales bacterium]MDP3839822.1 RnfH family protein [Methylococcales bacterium]